LYTIDIRYNLENTVLGFPF